MQCSHTLFSCCPTKRKLRADREIRLFWDNIRFRTTRRLVGFNRKICARCEEVEIHAASSSMMIGAVRGVLRNCHVVATQCIEHDECWSQPTPGTPLGLPRNPRFATTNDTPIQKDDEEFFMTALRPPHQNGLRALTVPTSWYTKHDFLAHFLAQSPPLAHHRSPVGRRPCTKL